RIRRDALRLDVARRARANRQPLLVALRVAPRDARRRLQPLRPAARDRAVELLDFSWRKNHRAALAGHCVRARGRGHHRAASGEDRGRNREGNRGAPVNPIALFIILASVGCQVGGQVFFKLAMNRTHDSGTARYVPMLAAGVGAMTLSFLLWIGLLSRFQLSQLFPFEGVERVMIVAAAAIFLREKM